MRPVVGNDVVDLRDPDARAGSLHPRFDALAFAPEERATLARAPEARRWVLWAAKEAAFKALRQRDAGLGFAPRRFVVTLGGDGRGRVRAGTRSIPVRWATDAAEGWVHAIACEAGSTDAVCWRVERVRGDDPGRAARRLAVAGLPAGAHVARLGRVPVLRLGARDAPLSLSHHGRFAAFARFDPWSGTAA